MVRTPIESHHLTPRATGRGGTLRQRLRLAISVERVKAPSLSEVVLPSTSSASASSGADTQSLVRLSCYATRIRLLSMRTRSSPNRRTRQCRTVTIGLRLRLSRILVSA